MTEFILFSLGKIALALSAAIVVVGLLRPLVRRQFGPHQAYALWLLAPVSMAASLLPARVLTPSLPVIAPGAALTETPTPQTSAGVSPGVPAATELEPALHATPPGLELASYWVEALLAIWALGLVASVIWFVRQHWRACADYLPMQPTSQDRVFLSVHDTVGPAVVGVVRPKIVLPSGFFERFRETEQRMILSHERAHLRHGDTRINMMICALQCLVWFNPLVHLAAAAVRQDQEMARDADALAANPGDAAGYSRALVTAQTGPATALPLGCAWTSTHPLVARVAQITRGAPTRLRGRVGYASIAALCVAGATSAWALQPPKLEPMTGVSALFALAADYGTPFRERADRLEIRLSQRVNLVFEDRADIEIRSASTDAPALQMIGDQLVVGNLNRTACETPQSAQTTADILIRVPENLAVTLAAQSDVRVAGDARGRVDAKDCTHVRLETARVPTSLVASDRATVVIGTLQSPATLVFADQSRLSIGAVDADLTLDQIGASQAHIGSASSPLKTTVTGASQLALETADITQAEMLVVGASTVSVGTGSIDALDLKVLGASASEVGARVQTADVSASGSADIALGDVGRWTILSRPDEDGRLSINGTVQPP